MGDIADAMLDGMMCQYCGEYIGGAVGYPRACRGCAADADREPETEDRKATANDRTRRRRNQRKRAAARRRNR